MNLNMTEVLYAMAGYLVAIGLNDSGDPTFEASVSKRLIRLRVMDPEGKVRLNVVGEDSQELGQQLALACLKKLTPESLKLIQSEPLKGVMQVLHGNGGGNHEEELH